MPQDQCTSNGTAPYSQFCLPMAAKFPDFSSIMKQCPLVIFFVSIQLNQFTRGLNMANHILIAVLIHCSIRISIRSFTYQLENFQDQCILEGVKPFHHLHEHKVSWRGLRGDMRTASQPYR